MSRYISTVSVAQVNKAFKTDITKNKTVSASLRSRLVKAIRLAEATKAEGEVAEEKVMVKVAHGYDRPCYVYFCDLEPDCELGIYYGVIGLTKQLDRWQYRDAMQALGLTAAVEAVEMDLPY